MNGLGMVVSIVVAVAFVLLAKDGHFGLAFGLLVIMFAYGLWRVMRFLQAAREREARQWERVDLIAGNASADPQDPRK
jgi:Flp pilus assembly protein TadB